MNPIKDALKRLSVTTVNVIVALVFFIVTARISSPAFFGKIAIIQLLESVILSFFYFIPAQIITKEISYLYAKKEVKKEIIGEYLTFPFLITPAFVIFLLFPNYIKFTIPYLFLYLLNSVIVQIMIGMDMFTESAITEIILLIIRWGISIISVILHNIYLFIEIWTLGELFSSSMNYVLLSRKVGVVLPYLDFPFLFKKFKESLPLYLSSPARFFSSQGDRITTVYFLGSYYLGIYQFSALVAVVPSMVLGTLNNVLLPTASFYKALGKDEKKMSSLSFRFLSILVFLAVIVSIPLGDAVITYFFPAYKEGIEVFNILLISATLPFSINSLSNFIIASNKDLKPFLLLSTLDAGLVLVTSFALIPRLGIIGGALSQIIVTMISSLFILSYAVKASVFLINKREAIVLSLFLVVGVLEVIIAPLVLALALLPIILLIFRSFKIINNEDVKVIESFLTRGLKFVSIILRIIER
ncbi:lipopolysaccharide biosynthesis protein [Acidianus sp. HS-5]|uniref:lipopolysaccharide biosynthesis protein n=1 Tax=Acidianus sp. HS-5 TaxID=2886040 RepID=UPI001F255F90|nr:lipopolysaccharide biosynthesis protein [Acidianus sp. HS-5]BDC18532.1 polysaccharide biosynthesis protein [Acidianus sp. HS-5]